MIDGHVGLVEPVSRLLTPEVAPMSGVERGGGTNAGDFAPVGSRVTRVLRLRTVGWKPDEG